MSVGSKNACLCSDMFLDEFVAHRLPQSVLYYDNFMIDDAMVHRIFVVHPIKAMSCNFLSCKVPDRQLTLVLQLDVTGHCEASGVPTG